MTFNSKVGSYTYPLASAPRPHAPLTAGSRSFTYNANGNALTDGIRSFTYDGENRPTAISGVTFAYGADGKRLKKTDTSLVEMLYLGSDVELKAGVWTKYLHPDAKRVGATTTWMHRDHLATIRLITDAAGSVAERANYLPFGDQFPGLSQSKGYIGEKHDPETGLLYLNARYYDPTIAIAAISTFTSGTGKATTIAALVGRMLPKISPSTGPIVWKISGAVT